MQRKTPSAALVEAGIDKSASTRWKNGKRPTDTALRKLADYFGVSPEELTGSTSPAQKKFPADVPNLGTKFLENVEILCKAKGVTATRACIESGLSRSFLTDIKGKSPDPRISSLLKLSEYFGVTIAELLGESATGGGEYLSQHERELLTAYRNADDERREIVQAALRPFGLCHAEETAM